MDVKRFTVPLTLKDATAGAEGSVQAAVSVFNEVDTQGDVVLPSFFTDGQEVPMAAWGHSWNELPPGKGVIRVLPSHALFDGAFFMDTTSGRDTYNTVKAMGALQEWSFGFGVEDAEPGTLGGAPVRFLKRGTIFESSPVLIGANRHTQTLAIKSGLSLDAHTAEVLATNLVYAERLTSLADVRLKEGRQLSAASRGRMQSHLESLRSITGDLEGWITETAPQPKGISPAEARALELTFVHMQTRLRGYLQE